jgi:precorrin-2/cobalt-factor-2 C20-methyltransferase
VITGRLLGIGVGPGDPELLTLKALRYLQAAPVVAYVSARGLPSIARQIAAPHLQPGQREINIALPMHPSPELADAAYDEGASRIGTELERGRDVAVLCEGDPLLYGSFNQLLKRLVPFYPTEVVPGITSITAAAAAARRPLATRTDVLAVLPATLPMEALRARLSQVNAAAILKVGRHLDKVRQVLGALNLLDRAIYVEQVTTTEQRVMPLVDMKEMSAPYFSLVLIPPEPDQ